MIDNARRLFLLVALLVVGAILVLVMRERPVKLGLDLAGGERLVVELEHASPKPGQSSEQLLEKSLAVLRERIDPDGTAHAILRPLGERRIEITIPESARITGKAGRSALAAAVAGEDELGRLLEPIRLSGTPEELEAFPVTGGVIEIGRERIRYASRAGDQVAVQLRGDRSTPIEAHAAGSSVRLVDDGQVERLVTEVGKLRFLIGASEAKFSAAGKDYAAAKQRVVEWLKRPENALVSLQRYNAVPESGGGPPEGFQWYVRANQPGPREARLQALEVAPADWSFTDASIAQVTRSTDDAGAPALSLKLLPDRTSAFTDFSEAHADENLAIVLDDEIVAFDPIEHSLPGEVKLRGSFSDREIDFLFDVLSSGSLDVEPVLLQSEALPPSLGQAAAERSWIAGLAALGALVAVLVLAYGALGVSAAVALAVQLLVLLGLLSALQVTLSLPGIAGAFLALAMCVDASVLIFQRIREEHESGKKSLAAAQGGFADATPAIVDTHLMALLSGAILYVLGIGPIRGFAVTWILGTLTSAFAALLVLRLCLHGRLSRNADAPFPMRRWLGATKLDLLGKRAALGASIAAIVAGLALFAWLPPERKLGIDSLGGASLRVRTEQPLPEHELRSRVAALGGEFATAEVVGLPSSRAASGDRYSQFRVDLELAPEADPAGAAAARIATLESELARGLAEVLQRESIELSQPSGGERSTVGGTLRFEERHPLADVQSLLASAKLEDPRASYRDDHGAVVDFEASVPGGLDEAQLKAAIQDSLAARTDSAGRRVRLAQPVSEATPVGPVAVGDLSNSAIRALLLAALVALIYLRVRFRETSFGLAAVAAQLCDLLLMVGAVSVLALVPFLHVQFGLATLAVLLAVAGFSMHDTLVLFDRIRENRPRMKGTLEEIVGASLKQTWPRTLVTSLALLASLAAVFLSSLGTHPELGGLAVAMALGIVVGSLSSGFVAAPLFLLFEKRALAKAETGRRREAEVSRGPNKASSA